MANSLGIIQRQQLASGNLVTCMHSSNIPAEGCGCPWKCPRAHFLFLEGGVIAVSGLVGFWNSPTGIQGSYAASGLGWLSTKCGQDVQWWSDSESQAERREEVDKSQVRSSIVNSLFPWGEPMYQGCFTFLVLNSQDAKPHLSAFLPSNAVGPSFLHVLEVWPVVTCNSMDISGSFKLLWSDLPNGFRGTSPSPDMCGEHKWDKGREVCVWRGERPGRKHKCLAPGKDNREQGGTSAFPGSCLWGRRSETAASNDRVSSLPPSSSSSTAEAQKLATSCCEKWAWVEWFIRVGFKQSILTVT